MEILCAYLRENAPARDARRHDLGPWPDYPDNPTDDDLKAREKALKERREALDLWITDLREHHAPRVDIQAAITVIGRRSPAQIALEQAPKEDGTPSYRLDLRKVNLQAADLSGLNLASARLDATHLEGATLGGMHIQAAQLVRAYLTGASLEDAKMEGANLLQANLERAGLRMAQLAEADLRGTHLQMAVLVAAQLQRALLDRAHLDSALVSDANLSGASLHSAHFEGAALLGAQLEGALLVGTHLEKADLRRAYLSRAVVGGSHLNGTVFGSAHLDGIFLVGSFFSAATSFRPATLHGAGLKDIDLSLEATKNDNLPRLLSKAFGDASVTLPDDLKAGLPPLNHWSTETLDRSEFETAWRAHQRAIGYVPPD